MLATRFVSISMTLKVYSRQKLELPVATPWIRYVAVFREWLQQPLFAALMQMAADRNARKPSLSVAHLDLCSTQQKVRCA